jgi:nucleoside 2-deoxyribosyltransferase
MSDWLDDLSAEERRGWDQFVDHVRRDTVQKMDKSAFVLSLVPSGGADVKFAVELGLAIMLDKPILAVAMPGAEVPAKMRQVADEFVEADVDLAEGRDAVVQAIQRLKDRFG